MRQTAAIFLDAYRELNARKLFWLTLIISVVVVAAFGLIGLNENGLRLVVWDVESSMLNSRMISPDTFYKGMFTSFGIGFWLAWLATILALVSTASIFPDLVTSGAIDLVLSKPISRLRLFITKYFSGLLFVALQVTVFSVASFMIIGLRGKAWEPGILLAIPIVLCFFSYLFAICTLLGLLTRSTIAALLVTLVIWFTIFGLHVAESFVLTARIGAEMKVESIERDLHSLELRLAPTAGTNGPEPERREAIEKRVAELRDELGPAQNGKSRWVIAHRVLMGFKTVLPKTSETKDYLERLLIDTADLPELEEQDSQAMALGDTSGRVDGRKVQRRLLEITQSRSPTWIIGTSLVFELVVLALAGWTFVRRDF